MAEDIEEIKKKKLEEQKKLMEASKAEEQLKNVLRVAVDEPGYERLMNISYANKEFYVNVAQNVIMLYKRAGRKITEDEVLQVIRAIKKQTQHETKIEFR